MHSEKDAYPWKFNKLYRITTNKCILFTWSFSGKLAHRMTVWGKIKLDTYLTPHEEWLTDKALNWKEKIYRW